MAEKDKNHNEEKTDGNEIRESKEDSAIDLSECDRNFKYELSKEAGAENIMACFSCGTCTGGCPVRAVDERYNPRKIIRMALLGMKEAVLSSDFIWLCSSCYTCQERCPQNVRIPEVMTVLKNFAVKLGYIPSPFIQQVKLLVKFGRLYEVDEFDNKKRKALSLPELETNSGEIKKIFEISGLIKFCEDE